ncbi:hypothetical protein J6590_107511, partial [Homalodisca vitripennis]
VSSPAKIREGGFWALSQPCSLEEGEVTSVPAPPVKAGKGGPPLCLGQQLPLTLKAMSHCRGVASVHP